MKNNVLIFGAVLCFAASSVIAADAADAEEKKEKESPWATTAGLGYVNTSGNTNTETLIFKFDTAYEIERWKHALHFDTLNSSAEDVTTADRKLFSFQSNYNFRPRDYFYGLFNYEDDKFSGFEYQAKLGLGYGRKIIKTDKHELDGEIGPGYRNFKPDNQPRNDEALLRLAGFYKWKISDFSDFNQDLVADFGELQDEWRSVTGLRTSINKTLSLRLTYTVRYLNVVPIGNDNYDRETAITLDYTF